METNQLNIIEQEVYKSIKKHKKSITIGNYLSVNDVNSMMQSILDSDPSIFFLSEWNCIFNRDHTVIKPLYLYSEKEIQKISQECDKQVSIIMSRTLGLPKYEAIKKVHDILIRNITYKNSDDFLLHTIVAPLLYRTAVCDGFSRLYKYVIEKIDIPCIVVRGRGYNVSLRESEAHLWNLVYFRNNWYHVDVTYDGSLSASGYIRYDYFMVDSKAICIDHYYEKSSYPLAMDNSMNPYNKIEVIKSKSELLIYFNNKINNKEPNFIIIFSYDIDLNKIESYIQWVINNSILQHNQVIQYNINYSKRIVHICIK